MEIRPYVLSEKLPDMTNLMREHWLETEPGVSETEPKPNAESYRAMEKAGFVVT